MVFIPVHSTNHPQSYNFYNEFYHKATIVAFQHQSVIVLSFVKEQIINYNIANFNNIVGAILN